MQGELETFVAEACYTLAKGIIDEYASRGFSFADSEDMQLVRKVNAAASLLGELGDHRGYELRIEVNNLVRFSPEIQVVRR